MKIGIISDIHGDFTALQTALNRLDNEHNVEQVICAGDLIGRGPAPDAVVDTIRQREIPTVRGNHDEWSYDISPINKAFLQDLPIDWYGDYGGVAVYMCHGKPGNNIWGLYEAHISATFVDMMLQSLEADVMVTGHTHVPMYLTTKTGCVVNPGSLYTVSSMRSSSHTYGVLDLNTFDFDLFDVTREGLEPVMMKS